MILGIGTELSIFLQAVLAGNFLYLIYTGIRIFRRLIRHTLFFVSLEDFLYWGSASLYLFVQMYQTSHGNIRWYFVIGVFGGGILTHSTVGKFIKKYIDKTKETG